MIESAAVISLNFYCIFVFYIIYELVLINFSLPVLLFLDFI